MGWLGYSSARAQDAAAPAPAPPAAAPAVSGVTCPSLSGQVIGVRKEPLVGATVILGGTRVLFSTNSEGFFTLTVPSTVTNPRLEISAAGYEPQEFAVPNCELLQIELRALTGTKVKSKGKRKGFIQAIGREDGSKVKVKF